MQGVKPDQNYNSARLCSICIYRVPFRQTLLEDGDLVSFGDHVQTCTLKMLADGVTAQLTELLFHACYYRLCSLKWGWLRKLLLDRLLDPAAICVGSNIMLFLLHLTHEHCSAEKNAIYFCGGGIQCLPLGRMTAVGRTAYWLKGQRLCCVFSEVKPKFYLKFGRKKIKMC